MPSQSQEPPPLGLPKLEPRFTVDEYLDMERAAEERHEFIDGQVYAMSGESEAHGIIVVNLVGMLYAQLRGSACSARTMNTKVRSGPIPRGANSRSGMYSYPDIVVVCGEREFHDAHTDVILNPTAIIEVLSPSTEAFDRGDKFKRFRKWNPTLVDYVLVCQDRPHIDHHHRESDGRWTDQEIAGLNAEFDIPSIRCTLRLAEVYERVQFPEVEE